MERDYKVHSAGLLPHDRLTWNIMVDIMCCVLHCIVLYIVCIHPGKVLTQQHKAGSGTERERLEGLGATILYGRLYGELAVSRSLGDAQFKAPVVVREKSRISQPQSFIMNTTYHVYKRFDNNDVATGE